MALQYTPMQGGEPPKNEAADTGMLKAETFDVMKARDEMNRELIGSQEIDRLVSTINVNDAQSVATFGGAVAEEISKCSDAILKSVDMDRINDSGELLAALGKIMDQFDLQEITEEKKGFFAKLMSNAQKQLDQILQKYHSMGDEVDKIYVQLRTYEGEIMGSNKKLEKMFETNVGYYKQLVKYILAGDQGVKELEELLQKKNEEFLTTQNPSLQFEITNLSNAKIMLEQRVHDLRIAENVAMQSIPMLKSMELSNMNLIRKINSAFIITLPVFKQALTQAVLLKRQRIQADAMQALDERTNEMLLRNAQNTAEQTKRIAAMASGNSVKVETLEATWQTIVRGIEETQQIQQDAKRRRQDEVQRLEQIKTEFERAMGGAKLK